MTNTPALTAEQRAEALWAQLLDADPTIVRYDPVTRVIASAIREAEDAAYERAAAKCDWFSGQNAKSSPLTSYIEGRADAGTALAGHILALKSQKETP